MKSVTSKELIEDEPSINKRYVESRINFLEKLIGRYKEQGIDTAKFENELADNLKKMEAVQ